MATINDPNNASLIAAVKAASTKATLADMALVVAIAPSGVTRPDGMLQVTLDPTSLLFDTFDTTLDTVDRWNALGTNIPTVATGQLTVSAGNTASNWSALLSKATLPLLGNMFLQALGIIQVDAVAKTGNYRFFGFLNLPGIPPTVSAPITDGVGLEFIDTTGAMSAVVWSGGVKTQTLALTAPTDGLFHRYQVYFKTSRAYFEQDGVVIGTLASPAPNTSIMSTGYLSVNGLSVLGSPATFKSTFGGVGDSGRNHQQLADGAFPWRKAVIKAPSVGATQFDNALVVTMSPNGGDLVGTTAALGALNAVATINAAGQATVGMLLAAGSLVGTIVPEVSYDGGTTWVGTAFDDPATGNKVASIVFGSPNGVQSRTLIGNGGASQFRVRVSAYTTGTANCTLRATTIYDPSVLFTGPLGGSLPLTIDQVGAPVSSTAPVLTTATLGALSLNLAGDLRSISKIQDGTNIAAVKAASTAAAAGDPALVVTLSPNSPLPIGTGLLGSVKIMDGTNTANVKAASTPAALTDPALVVAVSPNSVTTATATTSNVAASVTVVTVLASNTARKGAFFYNDGTSLVLLKLGSGASGTSFTINMPANSYYEVPSTPAIYTGIITAIWVSTSATMRVTEIS